MWAARTVLLVSVLSGTLLAGGCRRPGGRSGPSDSFDRGAMLANLGTNVLLPAMETFESEANELASATDALRFAVGTTGHAAALAEARVAFGDAMDAWQAVEVLQVGPAAPMGAATGGQGLRDEIYSWPTVNNCRVDQEIVSQDYEAPGFFEDELVIVYGLDALEYLLFYDGAGNACAPQIDINEQGTWNALGLTEITARRAAYADAVADRLVVDGAALVTAWDPAGGNFLQELSEAGLASSEYGSAQDAVNELFAALFYVELRVKDDKLGVPAGILPPPPGVSPSCAAVCVELLESRWSGRSGQNVAANLRAFRRALLGGESAGAGLGFDDFLVELGAADLAAGMEAKTDAAITAADAIPGPMEDVLETDPAPVVAAHAALKTMTDDLKSTFVTVLNLRVPDEGAGDND